MTHEERIKIAHRLSERIVGKYGEDVLAVYVTSSTAKGWDKLHSDLELTAVLRDGVEVEAKSYIYKGILVEISYPRESELLKQAQKVTFNWPLEAHEYRSRVVLFERNGWTEKLESVVQQQEEADFKRPLHLAMTVFIEGRDKLRNAYLAGNERNIRLFASWVAQYAASLVLFLNLRYMSSTSRFLEEALACPKQPRDFQNLVDILLGVTPADAARVGRSGREVERGTPGACQGAGNQGGDGRADSLTTRRAEGFCFRPCRHRNVCSLHATGKL